MRHNSDGNIEQFVRYFEAGCKEQGVDNVGAIGVELEHFVVHKDSLEAVTYGEEHGIGALLERLFVYFPENARAQGCLIGLGNDQYSISIEPAAQLEVSIVPQKQIAQIEKIYNQFLELVEPILEAWGQVLVTAGYSPKSCAVDLPLIPKSRYMYMDQYFRQIGSYGTCMMRGTASVQGTIDYCSEADFVRAYRAAVALGPLFSLITDNANTFEGKPWKGHMLRTHIWDRVDGARCGVVPGTFEEGFGFRKYAQYLYNVPIIFQQKDEEDIWAGEMSLFDLCERDIHSTMTRQQLEHGVSIVFPDVRLKQYIELRMADSMPIMYTCAYLAMLKGLFADRDKLYELYAQLEQFSDGGKITAKSVQNGKEQLIANGYDGMIYGRPAYEWLDRMLDLAWSQLTEEEQPYLKGMEELIRRRISVRDIM